MLSPSLFAKSVSIILASQAPVIPAPSIDSATDIIAASFEIPVETAEARGVLKASRSAEISAPMSARITHAPLKSGQSFRKGQVLVRFDCAGLMSERDSLQQAFEANHLEFETQSELFKAGASGGLEVDLAKARMNKSRAEQQMVATRIKDCQVYAPYAGMVTDTFVNVYETPAQNTPMLAIDRAGKPEISMIIPSSWLSDVTIGTEFSFTIDETGDSYPAKIIRKGGRVDAVSQTIEVTAKFTSSAKGALPGMSGVARFEQSAAP